MSYRAILIDPVAETVTEVQVEPGYKELYKWLTDKDNGIECSCFTVVNLNQEGDALYVDDEGLLKDPKYFFEWRGYTQPLSGRGLILGTDEEGETVSTKIGLEEVKSKISFRQLSVKGFGHFDGTTESGAFVIGSYPVFGPPNDKAGE